MKQETLVNGTRVSFSVLRNAFRDLGLWIGRAVAGRSFDRLMSERVVHRNCGVRWKFLRNQGRIGANVGNMFPKLERIVLRKALSADMSNPDSDLNALCFMMFVVQKTQPNFWSF